MVIKGKRKPLTMAEKVLSSHLVDGEMDGGGEIGIRIDQTLTQDATGTMAYLQFESMGIDRVRTELSVSYVDHNTLQGGFENADDHRFLETVAARYGAYFSRPGNGICHQVHIERFGVPGKTLLGSDSHTPTGGAIGMIAIGAGGLDVAAAMAGLPFYLPRPKVVNVVLKGRLRPWVSAKDIILEVLRRMGVKGGVGKIIEYTGPGVSTLSVPERATVTNMGAELGATTSIFPSDEKTRRFLSAQRRTKAFRRIGPDRGAKYDEEILIDLSRLEPLAAKPHSPGSVARVRDLEGMKVDQICIGSCTNSSLRDLFTVSRMLKGSVVAPGVSLTISPGSRQVYSMIAKSGALKDLIDSGARILESACGPCIGMGQAPPSKGVSLRTFNRNFEGRSGTKDAMVYLVSPETAAATALKGTFTDPRKLRRTYPRFLMPKRFLVDDRMIIPPPRSRAKIEVRRGPNIKKLPRFPAIKNIVGGEILLKVGDDITTDHIMPAGSKILPLRSNIPAISEHVFSAVDGGFPSRAREKGGGIILGGENYGQGSSREHAALAPRYLGVRAVIAKSFARIHHSNLVNFGIIPVVLEDPRDYERLNMGDKLEAVNVPGQLRNGDGRVTFIRSDGLVVKTRHVLSRRQIEVIINGGLLNSAAKKG